MRSSPHSPDNGRDVAVSTKTGKTPLAIANARSCIRAGTRVRFFNSVDLVNRLEGEARANRQGRLVDDLTRLDVIILDELGYLHFAQAGGQLLFYLISRPYERTSIIVTFNLAFGEWPSLFRVPFISGAVCPAHISRRMKHIKEAAKALFAFLYAEMSLARRNGA